MVKWGARELSCHCWGYSRATSIWGDNPIGATQISSLWAKHWSLHCFSRVFVWKQLWKVEVGPLRRQVCSLSHIMMIMTFSRADILDSAYGALRKTCALSLKFLAAAQIHRCAVFTWATLPSLWPSFTSITSITNSQGPSQWCAQFTLIPLAFYHFLWGTRRVDTSMRPVLPSVLCVIKSVVSPPGSSCLLPASLKLAS